jgi:hypothetical protein
MMKRLKPLDLKEKTVQMQRMKYRVATANRQSSIKASEVPAYSG